jgi:hypothetical protein
MRVAAASDAETVTGREKAECRIGLAGCATCKPISNVWYLDYLNKTRPRLRPHHDM